jgi:hypothetical protein
MKTNLTSARIRLLPNTPHHRLLKIGNESRILLHRVDFRVLKSPNSYVENAMPG